MARTRTAVPAPSFEEAMRSAESEAGIPPDTELYGEFLAQPEEDEAGRIPASRPAEAEAPEPAPPAEGEPEPSSEAESEPVLLAGKYKDVAALEKAYLEAQKVIGEQGSELGSLRGLRDEFETLRTQLTAPAPLSLDEPTVNWFDELAEQNPGQAAYWALQQSQPVLYDRAIRSWYEQDPIAAGRYERQVELASLQQSLQAQIAPQIEGAQALAQRSELESALGAVAARHEDFAQVVGVLDDERLTEIVSNGFPVEVLQALEGDQAAKQRVFETLYRWVKAEQAGTLVEAATAAAGRQASESRQAKVEATVASASTTTPESVPETEQERLMRVWEDQTPSLRKAWKGQESRRAR